MMPNVPQVASTDYRLQPILDARNVWTQESVMLQKCMMHTTALYEATFKVTSYGAAAVATIAAVEESHH